MRYIQKSFIQQILNFYLVINHNYRNFQILFFRIDRSLNFDFNPYYISFTNF